MLGGQAIDLKQALMGGNPLSLYIVSFYIFFVFIFYFEDFLSVNHYECMSVSGIGSKRRRCEYFVFQTLRIDRSS